MAGSQGGGIGQVPSLSEDDMKEGDLGDGMSASSVAGHHQRPVRALSRSKTDLVEPLSHLKLSKRGSGEDSGAAFTWVPCSEMYRAFREDLEAERGTRRRSRDSDSSSTDSSEVLQRRLQEATERSGPSKKVELGAEWFLTLVDEREVELLRTELEVTHRHLEGKHEAVRILQGQAILDKATSHTKILLQKSEERNKVLEKEVNALQWEITFNQVQFKNVEHEWGLRYDRVCAENKVLSKALDERLEQVQQLRTENTSLSQQCLELLGLLSAQDRNDFQKTRPPCCQGREGLSLELAVYGACQCISNMGEPCPCAKSAAASRKQVLQLKKELELQKRMKDEAYVMMDAFRIAFEQQLRRGSQRVLQLAESDRQAPRRSKPFERVKQTSTSITQRLRMFLPFINDGKVLSEPMETLQLLLDLLSDKEEALAHQRKVSYMLARSSEDLERQLHAELDHSKNHTASEMDTREKVECDEDDCSDNGLSGTYSKKTASTSEDQQRSMTDIPDGVTTENEN